MKTLIRRLFQIASAAALTYLFLSQNFMTASTPFFTWSGWLDPLSGLAGFIHRQWPWLILGSAALIGPTLWMRRIFCGWVCPVGLVLDLEGTVKTLFLKDLRLSRKSRRYLEFLRWTLFAAAIAMVVFGHAFVLSFNPLVLWAREVNRLVNHAVPWSIISLILLGLLTFPRFWCRYLCPAGTLFGLFSRFRGRTFEAGEDCRRCSLCVRRCPMGNIDPELRFGADCIGCGECRKVCRQRCIRRPAKRVSTVDEGRRDLLVAACAGAGLAMANTALRSLPIQTGNSNRRWSRLLRPPGALSEEEFNATCDRCSQCLNACPTRALVPAGLEAGLMGLATPRFVPRKGRCMLEQCQACLRVCPTGALAPVSAIRLGTARVDRDQCVAWAQGHRCLLCVEVCPTFALRIDGRGRPVLDPSKCVGCGACENNCPVQDSAVRVFNEGEKRR